MAGKIKNVFEGIKNFFNQAQRELKSVRTKIADIESQIQQLERMPIGLGAAQAKVKTAVADIGRKFEERFERLSFMNEQSDPQTLVSDFRSPDAFLLLCWALPDVVEQRMQPVLAEFLERIPGVDPQVRSEKLTTLRATLGELEVEEENLIRSASECGMRIGRRPTADPSIVLSE